VKKKLSTILCAFALTIMAIGIPAHAEDNNNNVNRAYDNNMNSNYNNNANRAYNNNDVMTRNVNTDTGAETTTNNDTNWEWLGLLGLVGLFGLRRKEKEAR